MTEENKLIITETIAKLKELKNESEKIEKEIETKISEKDKTKFEETRTKFSSITTKFFKKAGSKINLAANDIAHETKSVFSKEKAKEDDFDIAKIASLVEETNKKILEVRTKFNSEDFEKDSMSVLQKAQSVSVFIEGKIDELQMIINRAK